MEKRPGQSQKPAGRGIVAKLVRTQYRPPRPQFEVDDEPVERRGIGLLAYGVKR
jgi:hypothetical protein